MNFKATRFLLPVIVVLTGVVFLIITMKARRHTDTQDHPDALRAKIDEIRRRLTEELQHQLPPSAFPAGPEASGQTP